MAVVSLHHAGVVVRDLDAAYPLFRDALGLPLRTEEQIADQGVRAALLDLGNAFLELLQPTQPDTGIARYLDRWGEGLHHVCLEVDDINATLAGLKAKQLPLIDEAPRPGLTGTIAFLHPSALHGTLVELVDAPTAVRPHAAGPIVRRLHHVVSAVAELPPALHAWSHALSLTAAETIHPAGAALELAVLHTPTKERRTPGDRDPRPATRDPAFIELVCPTLPAEDSQIGQRVAAFLAGRGEGMLSLSLEVGSLTTALDALRAAGIACSPSEPGLLPDTTVARLAPDAAHGVSLQLLQEGGEGRG